MPRIVHPTSDVALWALRTPGPHTDPLLLVADAGMSAVMWPDKLVLLLAQDRPVIRYDQRDTGRSRVSAHDEPYGLAELAADAVAVLDAYEVDRAHVLGWGTGGLVAQLVLLDHADRVCSVTLLGTGPLPGLDAVAWPPPPQALVRLWAEVDDPRDRESELAWRLAHDRILHGSERLFDAVEFRRRHERAMRHAGTEEPVTAHTGLDVPARGAELRRVDVPALVVEAPADPVFPPPSSTVLASVLPGARLVRLPGLGHVIGPDMVRAVAEVIVEHLFTAVLPTRPFGRAPLV